VEAGGILRLDEVEEELRAALEVARRDELGVGAAGGLGGL
jgi:glycerate kinase